VRGSTAIEYALVASLIAIAIVAAVQNVGGKVLGLFESVVAAF
jgi:Flp pilus assembly pilin Flp